MPFNINEIKSALNKQEGVLYASHFMVRVSGAKWLPNDAAGYQKNLSFFCEATSLPGVGFQTAEIKPYGIGFTEKRPYSVMYRDWFCDILVDGKGDMVNFFYKWVNAVSNINSNTLNNQAVNGLRYHEFAYPSSYWATIEVIHYNQKAKEIIHYTLHQAYPIEVSDTPVAWAASNQILRLPILFSYRNWTSKAFPAPTATTPQSGTANPPTTSGPVMTAALAPNNIAMLNNTSANQSIYKEATFVA